MSFNNINGTVDSGSGTLLLSAANVTTGALTANRGTVTLSGANGSWKGTGTSFTVNAGGTLVLDNATNNNDRLLDAGAFNLMGGTLSLVGNATSEAAGAFKAYGSAAIAFAPPQSLGVSSYDVLFNSYAINIGARKYAGLDFDVAYRLNTELFEDLAAAKAAARTSDACSRRASISAQSLVA